MKKTPSEIMQEQLEQLRAMSESTESVSTVIELSHAMAAVYGAMNQ